MKATIAERGQVTIPKALRDKLGLRPGTVLDFRLENGQIIATKVLPGSPVDAVYGCLGQGLDTDALMAELRGDS